MSTQSSTKRIIIGSSEASGVDRNFFDENMSVSDCKAAWFWPTDTRPSACFKTVSGFENGAIIVEGALAEPADSLLPETFRGQHLRAVSKPNRV